jgi:hypothetical protein
MEVNCSSSVDTIGTQRHLLLADIAVYDLLMMVPVQSIPGNPLATVALEAVGALWPALQDLLLRVDVEVMRKHICTVCQKAIHAKASATGSCSFLPLLPSFLTTSVMVRSSKTNKSSREMSHLRVGMDGAGSKEVTQLSGWLAGVCWEKRQYSKSRIGMLYSHVYGKSMWFGVGMRVRPTQCIPVTMRPPMVEVALEGI